MHSSRDFCHGTDTTTYCKPHTNSLHLTLVLVVCSLPRLLLPHSLSVYGVALQNVSLLLRQQMTSARPSPHCLQYHLLSQPAAISTQPPVRVGSVRNSPAGHVECVLPPNTPIAVRQVAARSLLLHSA